MSKKIQLTDEQIVTQVREGKTDLYALLIRKYQAKLLRYAAYLTSSDAGAADAVQESFIKAYKNLHGFDTRKKFSTWIYRIVHNEVMNDIGKQKWYQPIELAFDVHSEGDMTDDLVHKELLAHMHLCLQKMPMLYKEPLTLFFLEEKSYDEISDILRIPMGTVATRINRAKAMVRKLCQQK